MASGSALDGRRPALVAAAVVAVVGLICAGVTTVLLVRGAERDAEQEFVESAEQTAIAVQRQVESYLDELHDIGAFVVNSPTASPDEFQGFVEDTGLFQELPSLVGVLFLERVEDADLEAFVERKRESIPGFELLAIGPSQPGEVHYVLTYYAPGPIDLELPIGTDATPIEALSELIAAAEGSGRSVAGSFQDDPYLVQVAEDTDFEALDVLVGLDFFVGVAASAKSSEGVPEGPLLGWVGAPVDEFVSVLEAAAEGQPENLGTSLSVDLTDAGFGGRGDLERAAEIEGSAGPRRAAVFERSQTFTAEGIEFEMVVWSESDADALPVTVPVVAVGVTVAALLAASVVYLRLRSRERERALSRAVSDREQFQSDIIASVNEAMVVLDDGGRIVGANPAWSKLRAGVDHPAEEPAVQALGEDYRETIRAIATDGGEALADAMGGVLAGSDLSIDIDVPIREGRGHRWYAVRVTPLRGQRGGAVVVHSDITERKRSHDELEFRVTRDDLTGLLNRRALEAEADAALARARARNGLVAVLFVDLDGFKPINDLHGHAVGDEVLRAVARRLAGAVRTSDRVARFGGDEFVVLIGSLSERDVAERTAERILRSFDAPVRVEKHDIAVAVSIGVAVIDGPGTMTRDMLVEAADEAMYRAKQGGGGRSVSASPADERSGEPR